MHNKMLQGYIQNYRKLNGREDFKIAVYFTVAQLHCDIILWKN